MAEQYDEFDATIQNPPTVWVNNRLHFFKYMSESTAKAVLRNRTLRWSTAAELNDPFEMQLNVSVENLDLKKIKREALEKIWRLYTGKEAIKAKNPLGFLLEFMRVYSPGISREELFEDISKGIDESFKEIRKNAPKSQKEIMALLSPVKILSLTSAPDIILMWSHYANAHKGVVMRFRSIPALDSPFGMARPVQYTDVRPTFFTESYLINSLAGLETVNAAALNDAVIYTKMSEWSYEKEWRISSGNGRSKDAAFEDLRFGSNELDGLIFGLRISDNDRDEIKSLTSSYPNVELMKAGQTQGAGRLRIDCLT